MARCGVIRAGAAPWRDDVEFIGHPAFRTILAALFAGAALVAGIRGVRLLAQALGGGDRPDRSRRLVRGIRALTAGTGAALLGAGLIAGSRRLLILGAIFLAEEIYETGAVLLALRTKTQPRPTAGRPLPGWEPPRRRCGTPGSAP